MSQEGDLLAQELLHAPMQRLDRPEQRWCYRLIPMLLVSLYLAYHMTILGVWNLPSKGIVGRFNPGVLKPLEAHSYFRATSNTQSWAMFAPNPNRSNTFVRVLVEDHEGEIWDMKHDIYGTNRYPYWFYDRNGKINRRIAGKKGYQRYYAAWVCRDWARRNGGQPPATVSFVKITTRVPTPKVAWKSRGYNPWELPSRQKYEETLKCRTLTHGQLSPKLVQRFGLPEQTNSDYPFIDTRVTTWWDRKPKEAKEAKEKPNDIDDM